MEVNIVSVIFFLGELLERSSPRPLQELFTHFLLLNFKICALYPHNSSRMCFGTTTQNALTIK